jgi:hypothetical protein
MVTITDWSRSAQDGSSVNIQIENTWWKSNPRPFEVERVGEDDHRGRVNGTGRQEVVDVFIYRARLVGMAPVAEAARTGARLARQWRMR